MQLSFQRPKEYAVGIEESVGSNGQKGNKYDNPSIERF